MGVWRYRRASYQTGGGGGEVRLLQDDPKRPTLHFSEFGDEVEFGSRLNDRAVSMREFDRNGAAVVGEYIDPTTW